MSNFIFKNNHLIIRDIKKSDLPKFKKHYLSDNYLFADFKENDINKLFNILLEFKNTDPRNYYIFIIESVFLKSLIGFFSLYINNHKHYMVTPPQFEGIISLRIKNNYKKYHLLENIISALLKYFNDLHIFQKFSVLLTAPSQKEEIIFTNLGFLKEGLLKEYNCLNEKWQSRHIFSLLAKELK